MHSQRRRCAISEYELELISELYSGAVSAEGLAQTLDRFALATGGSGTLIIPMQTGLGVMPVWSASIDEGVQRYLAEGWWEKDARITKAQSLGLRRGVFSDVDFISQDYIRRDEFYQDFLRPLGYGSMLCRLAVIPDGPPISISVQREFNSGLFGNEELERFTRLSEHAYRALCVGTSMAALRLEAELHQQTRRYRAHGYVLLDAAGRILHADRLAASLFRSVLRIVDRKVTTEDRSKRTSFERLVRSALPGQGPPRRPLALSIPGQHYNTIVRAAPLVRDRRGADALVAGSAILIFHDLAYCDDADIQDLVVALGLTKGQSRVAINIARGLGVKDVAEILGISQETVKSVQKAIYVRLGISKQTQLASLITKLRDTSPLW